MINDEEMKGLSGFGHRVSQFQPVQDDDAMFTTPSCDEALQGMSDAFSLVKANHKRYKTNTNFQQSTQYPTKQYLITALDNESEPIQLPPHRIYKQDGHKRNLIRCDPNYL
jgi:hypothetical protein